MKTHENDTMVRFNDLFSQLLHDVAEEEALKAGDGSSAQLIEIRSRLQGLRSELAAIRGRLATEATPHSRRRLGTTRAVAQQPTLQRVASIASNT